MTLTVHHLQVSQSERIVWLCEELDIDYVLKIHKRDPFLSPQSIKDLHPLAAAPIIQDGALTLAESAACADYIIHIHGSGRLALPPTHPQYAKYIYWFHFANGTLQPTVGRLMTLAFAGVDAESAQMRRMEMKMGQYLRYMDDHLSRPENPWLGGEEFTAADVLNVFTLTTMRKFYPLDLSAYGHILGFLERATKREGWKRARAKGDPGLESCSLGPPPESFKPA